MPWKGWRCQDFALLLRRDELWRKEHLARAPLGTPSFFKYFAKEMETEVQNNFTFPHMMSYSLNCCNSHDRNVVRAVFLAVMRLTCRHRRCRKLGMLWYHPHCLSTGCRLLRLTVLHLIEEEGGGRRELSLSLGHISRRA